MLDHTGFRRVWGRRRGLLAVAGTVLALSGIAIAIAPPPSSQAAQGTQWSTGMPAAGVLTTNITCSVTVVSQWLAITAKHCGTVNSKLKLNGSEISNGKEYRVKSITPNPTLDVEAIFLEKQTGLTVLPLANVAQDRLYVWGYGYDHSNNATNHLTRADFAGPKVCSGNSTPEFGSLCWDTTADNSVCSGDSGGAVTQNGAIIGMETAVVAPGKKPDGSIDCSTVVSGQGISVQQMRPWLDQMIKDADPVI